jgi:hypothetical protein
MALDETITYDALTDLLRQTRFRTASALEVLRRQAEMGGRPTLGYAYFDVVERLGDHVRDILGLASSIHELAPRLLLRLANGEAPYGVDERTDRVALVLRRLRQHDLIEQPHPRTWQIAEPLMSAAMRRLAGGRHHVEIYPDSEVTA